MKGIHPHPRSPPTFKPCLRQWSSAGDCGSVYSRQSRLKLIFDPNSLSVMFACLSRCLSCIFAYSGAGFAVIISASTTSDGKNIVEISIAAVETPLLSSSNSKCAGKCRSRSFSVFTVGFKVYAKIRFKTKIKMYKSKRTTQFRSKPTLKTVA